MRADRPLISSVLCLAAGLGLIFGYCNGTAGISAAYPLTGASVNICTTTTGPGALGGVVLTALGALLLIWALLCAIVSLAGGKRPVVTKVERVETVERHDPATAVRESGRLSWFRCRVENWCRPFHSLHCASVDRDGTS